MNLKIIEIAGKEEYYDIGTQPIDIILSAT